MHVEPRLIQREREVGVWQAGMSFGTPAAGTPGAGARDGEAGDGCGPEAGTARVLEPAAGG